MTPSVDGQLSYRPCQVVLHDGRTVDRVYVQEAWTWKGVWGVWPEDDRGKASLSIDDVERIEESPSRIAPRLADRLLEAGESGMGYTKFTLVLRDGRKVNTMTGNAVDFPGLPAGVTASDVVDVIPHQHVGDSRDDDGGPAISVVPLYASFGAGVDADRTSQQVRAACCHRRPGSYTPPTRLKEGI